MQLILTFTDSDPVSGSLVIENPRAEDFNLLAKIAAHVKEAAALTCVRILGIHSDRKIHLIKTLRDVIPSLSLKEAKDIVDGFKILTRSSFDLPSSDMTTNEARCEVLKDGGFTVSIVRVGFPRFDTSRLDIPPIQR